MRGLALVLAAAISSSAAVTVIGKTNINRCYEIMQLADPSSVYTLEGKINHIRRGFDNGQSLGSNAFVSKSRTSTEYEDWIEFEGNLGHSTGLKMKFDDKGLVHATISGDNITVRYDGLFEAKPYFIVQGGKMMQYGGCHVLPDVPAELSMTEYNYYNSKMGIPNPEIQFLTFEPISQTNPYGHALLPKVAHFSNSVAEILYQQITKGKILGEAIGNFEKALEDMQSDIRKTSS